jgi:6-phosphogluconolactonase
MAPAYPGVVVLEDAAAVAREGARRFVGLGREAIAARGLFHAALSGGKTPGLLFRVLAEDEFRNAVDWKRTHLYWSDERSVPPGHSDSNYGLASRELLARISIPPDNVHRMEAEREDADRAAEEYEQLLRRMIPANEQGYPSFDLIYLGMGGDGHTASLFPGSPALEESSRAVVCQFVVPPGLPRTRRMTFTFPLLNSARTVIFLVTGADKAGRLREVLEGTAATAYPAQRIRPVAGERIVLADRAAAAQMGAGSTAAAGDAL